MKNHYVISHNSEIPSQLKEIRNFRLFNMKELPLEK